MAIDLVKMVTETLKFESPIQSNSAIRNQIQIDEYKLKDWAYLGKYDQFLERLVKLALDEPWSYRNGLPKSPKYPILDNYIRCTFCRLQHQHKVVESVDGKYAAFNTGLVDCRFLPILALFERNKENYKSNWRFFDFVFSGEGKGKLINDLFKEDIAPASYYDNPQDLIYDLSKGKPEVDKEHIISRVERLPVEIVKQMCPNDNIVDPRNMSRSDIGDYKRWLSNQIKSKPELYRFLIGRIESALDLAMKKVRWDYKYAVPIFYPNKNEMSFILPLCLADDQHEDLALIVRKTIAGNYRGETIIPLDWAYMDARVVARPNVAWLNVNEIDGQK